jgi:hypothetical protein
MRCYAGRLVFRRYFCALEQFKNGNYRLLAEMYEDSYFPRELVRKGEDILRNCACR